MVLQVHSTDPAQAQRAADVIRRRLDELGLDDPEVAVQGNRISLHVGDVEDRDQLHRVVLFNTEVGLHLVRLPSGDAPATSRDEILTSSHGRLPANLEILSGESRQGEKRSTFYVAVEQQPLVTGSDFATVRASQNQSAEPTINFRLRSDAAAGFAKATGDNIGSRLAVVLNWRVVSAPKIMARITGEGVLDGGFTQQEVEALIAELRSGPLPADLTLMEEQTLASSRHGLSKAARTLLLDGGILLLCLLSFLGLRKRRAPRGAL
jgi:protein-export membrane protein SecD